MVAFDWRLIFGGLQAFLAGQNPYGAPGYYSTPPFTLLFAPLGLLPFAASFALLTALTLALFIMAYRRRAAYWLAFVPVLYILFVGQVDLIFVSLAALIRSNKRGALLAALITMKPQIAVILLPFLLLKWYRENRRLLLWWLGFTALLWGIPAALYPSAMLEWIRGVTSGQFGHQGIITPGLWALAWISPIAPLIIGLLCLPLIVWAIRRDEATMRTVMVCISPVGFFYGTVTLIECAPKWILVPAGVVAGYMAVHMALPMWWIIIPLTACVWNCQGLWRGRALRLIKRAPVKSHA